MSEPTQVSPQVHVIGSSETASGLPSRRFTVVEKLGEGGMGAVYAVEDRERQARVAFKTLRNPQPGWVERLKHEFRSLQDLHHPNLVSLGELVEEEGQWGFTMELVRGCTFLQYVRPPQLQAPVPPSPSGQTETEQLTADPSSEPRSPPRGSGDDAMLKIPHSPEQGALGSAAPTQAPVRETACIDEARLRASLAQLAQGLQALHRAGKVHRDIKPSNILVTDSGRVVVLDFGVLSDVQGGGVWSGRVVGTASYMAPEQAEGALPSPEADWYSVGVLLYECLTGARPFSGGPEKVLHAKRRMDPVPPQARVSGLPEDLTALCMELLQRNPAQRPTHEQVLKRLGVQAEPAWATVMLPFVGRRTELQVLQQALADSRQGGSVAVRVEGESGVGKSRLMRRFLEEAGRQWPEALVLRGRCYERESVPYKGVDGLMDGLARYLAGLDEASARALRPQDSGVLARLFPVLQPALGLATPGVDGARADPLQVRVAAFLALRELMGRLATRAPVLLCVDDLQWVDRDGLVLLDEVLRAPGILLVATVRTDATGHEDTSPTEAQEVRFLRDARKLPLKALPPIAAQELVAQLLGAEGQQQPEQARRIAEESGGQPLFIDALVRHHRVSESSERPLQLEEALWARVQHLEPAAQQLLELLAVADGPLPQSVAARATTIDFADYGRQTAALRTAHLVLTSGPAGSDHVEVVHDRVRRAVVQHLEPSTQRLWHLRLASSLEELGQGEAETVARHWREAGHEERAVGYYLKAAREAGAALAFAREAALYATALELGRFEETERRRLQLARAEALANEGRGALAAAAFLEAAQGKGGAESHALRRRAAEQYLGSGHVQEGRPLLRQVLAEVGLSYPRSTGAMVARLLWVRLRLALRPLHFRLRPPEQIPALTLRRADLCWIAGSALNSSSTLESFYFKSRYLLEARAAGEQQRIMCAYMVEALTLALLGSHHRARIAKLLAHLEPLVAQCTLDAHTRILVRLGRLAVDYCVGDLVPMREHVGLLHQELREVKSHSWSWVKASAWLLWAETTALSGELVELSRRLAQPVAEARERGDRYSLTMLQMGSPTLGLLARGEPAQARQVADELIALWPDDPRLRQRFSYSIALSHIDLYEGHGRKVLERLEVQLPPHARSILRAAPARCRVYDLRLKALLMEAGRRQGSEMKRLLSAAEADARRLEREGMKYGRVLVALARAGIALRRGSLEEAMGGYGQAATLAAAQGMRLHEEVACWRQAELVGGVEGKTRLAALKKSMLERGLAVPEAMVGLVAPAPQDRGAA